jgi:integrase
MEKALVVDIEPFRERTSAKKRKGDSLNRGKKGRVYARSRIIWVDFYYHAERVREPSGLANNPENLRQVRKMLDLITAEIETGLFVFAKRFPHSKKRDYFSTLEGRQIKTPPSGTTFGEYVDKWWETMVPGMSVGQKRDYQSILEYHLKPYFGRLPFSEFTPVLIKKFVSHLSGTTTPSGTKLSGKRVQNIIIPLRVIVRDAIVEYHWSDLDDPFKGVSLPAARKMRIFPFDHREWQVIMKHMPEWYRHYFWFAVQTGLRPSEQVALKWTAVDAEYVHIELSRVRNVEKDDLKTDSSRRSIQIRPAMAETLRAQRQMTGQFGSPYVFTNTQGRPILQDKLRELWHRVMGKTGVRYRRMYEIRHTFASWALPAGETPEWVARTLGHVDTSMVYRTYGRYIPNLTRQDGSAFERMFTEAVKAERNSAIGTNLVTNGKSDAGK